jgi:RimJ/RimL family protein N-acetyltransferase
MKLTALTKENCEQVRQWRNSDISGWRTPYLLTQEQQEEFYNEVICNRESRSRFWGLWQRCENYGFTDVWFLGMGGFENIEFENGRAEIGLIVKPENEAYFDEAVTLLLHEGFANMGLQNIYGEVYQCSPYFDFWHKIARKYNANCVILPETKRWNNQMYDSLFFTVNRDDLPM